MTKVLLFGENYGSGDCGDMIAAARSVGTPVAEGCGDVLAVRSAAPHTGSFFRIHDSPGMLIAVAIRWNYPFIAQITGTVC